ncbi:hypothetical protein [Caulobacter sp. 1776]|uniref:hypothetical protein n=1 Tax=Caulobacter sp. 1776 TaxID=3156420 RepID=UPI003396650D
MPRSPSRRVPRLLVAVLAASLSLAFMSLAPLATARAAEPSEPLPAPAQAKVDAFLAQLKAGKVKEAYDGAFAGTLMSKKQAEVEQAIAGTETGLRYYGAVRDWQLMETARPAAGFAVAIYMVRLENAPLFVRFQLYDNGARWIVYNVTFSDSHDTAKTW